MSKSKTEKTYTITASPEAHDAVERTLVAMQTLAGYGSSRTVQVDVDGDGGFSLTCLELRDRIVDRAQFEALTNNQVININGLKVHDKASTAPPAPDPDRIGVVDMETGESMVINVRVAVRLG